MSTVGERLIASAKEALEIAGSGGGCMSMPERIWAVTLSKGPVYDVRWWSLFRRDDGAEYILLSAHEAALREARDRALPDWDTPEFDGLVQRAIDHAQVVANEQDESSPSDGMVEQIVWCTIKALKSTTEGQTG